MKASEYEIMFRVEDSHWWYRALHRWIFWALTRYVPGWKDKEILDAGCGTGAVLKQLANPHKHIGIDLAAEAVGFCRQRGLENVKEANIMSLPFADETFDAVICSSVLYHQWVTDVPKALNELRRVLRAEGVVILNLPACKFLHSAHDDAVLTAHRFSRQEVCSLLEQNGFQICKLTAWTTLLFPAALLARTFRMVNSGRDFEASRGPHLAVLNWLMALEFRVLQSISVPLGVSLFCIARKRSNRTRCENNAALQEALG